MEPRPLDDAEAVAWKAIRLRLTHDQPWARSAVLRCTPVAAPGADRPAGVDQWGRVYVDFSVESTKGLPKLADAVFESIRHWLEGTATPQPWHVSRDDERFPALTPVEVEEIAILTASSLRSCPRPKDFSQEAKKQAPWREWADALVGPPRVSWQNALSGHLRRAFGYKTGDVDYTYSRPSRRRVPGVALPAMRKPQLTVAVIADVSPSIVPQLGSVMAEIGGIGRAVGVSDRSVTVYATDSEVIGVISLGANLASLPTREEGGTDLRVGISAALASRSRPSILIVLTDGFTPWPEAPPPVPMIVALIGNEMRRGIARDKLPRYHLDAVEIDTPEDDE